MNKIEHDKSSQRERERELFCVTHILTLAIVSPTFKNTLFKRIVHPEIKLALHLLTFMLFQTRMTDVLYC